MKMQIKEIEGLANRLEEELFMEGGPVIVLYALADACEKRSQYPDYIGEVETEEEKQHKRNLLRVSVLVRDLSDLILMYEDVTEKEYQILKEFLGLNKKEETSEV